MTKLFTNKSSQHKRLNLTHQSIQFKDNRPEATTQLKIQQMANNAVVDTPIPRRTNKTGMPDSLKSGIENLSGLDMSDVKVHYNSSQPAQLQAHAFAQGNQIHIASGQERHLPHEAWHVVQQKQGRVFPTKQLKGKININDDAGLEKEADVMGIKALSGVNQYARTSTTLQKKAGKTTYQLLKEEEYQKLDSLFSGHLTYENFYKEQMAFQGGSPEKATVNLTKTKDVAEDKTLTTEGPAVSSAPVKPSGTVEEKAPPAEDEVKKPLAMGDKTSPYDFTTFGMEYEMIPYHNKNSVANTAHIKLATGNTMPISSYAERLVTDSDNVIEYVTPVFALPIDKSEKLSGLGAQTAKNISTIRSYLTNFRKSIMSANPQTFDDLVKKSPLAFIPWSVEKKLDISFKEIDEKTHLPSLATAFGWNEADIAKVSLGSDAKNAKHDELKRETQEGSAMQSTVLLPLDLIAKVVHKSMAPDKPPVVDKVQSRGGGKAAPTVSKPVGSFAILFAALTKSVPGAENPILRSYITLFCQRLSLIIESPHAVLFQSHYQFDKMKKSGIDPRLATASPPVIDDATTEGFNKELFDEYTRQEAEYQPKGTPNPHNFHNAHSGIKDRLDIWTRVHLDDVIFQIMRIIGPKGKTPFIEETIGFLDKLPNGAEIIGKFSTVAYSDADTFTKHEPIPFLGEHPDYMDLRQDTLRDIVEIGGRPWVLVELRDLKDQTLTKFADQADKP